MKKYLVFLFVATILFALVACGTESVSSTTEPSSASNLTSSARSEISSIVASVESTAADSGEWVTHTYSIASQTVTFSLPAAIIPKEASLDGPVGEITLVTYTTDAPAGFHVNPRYVESGAKVGAIFPYTEYSKVSDTLYQRDTLEGMADFHLSDSLEPRTLFLYNDYVVFIDYSYLHKADFCLPGEPAYFSFWINGDNPEESIELFKSIIDTVSYS